MDTSSHFSCCARDSGENIRIASRTIADRRLQGARRPKIGTRAHAQQVRAAASVHMLQRGEHRWLAMCRHCAHFVHFAKRNATIMGWIVIRMHSKATGNVARVRARSAGRV